MDYRFARVLLNIYMLRCERLVTILTWNDFVYQSTSFVETTVLFQSQFVIFDDERWRNKGRRKDENEAGRRKRHISERQSRAKKVWLKTGSLIVIHRDGISLSAVLFHALQKKVERTKIINLCKVQGVGSVMM